MKKRMIKLMTIFCMAGILTVNPAIIGLAEEAEAVGADVSEGTEEVEEEPAEEETEQEEDPAAAEDVEKVSEEEPETETEKSDVVLEEEAGEVSEAVMMSVNEAAMPVMMAAENGEKGAAEGQYVVTYIFDDEKQNDSSSNEAFKPSFKLMQKPELLGEVYTITGYDFIGWEKGGKIYSPGATYEVTDEDRKSKNITFTAVWRQQVSLSVDGREAFPLTAGEGAKAAQVTYNLSNIELSVPSDFYESADKWVINDNGTPCDATDIMTVKFEDKNNTQVYNAVSVNVDGKTDVPIENNTINLYSCWKPTNGYYDFKITNGIKGASLSVNADNNHTTYTYQDASYIDTLSEKDTITFSVENKGWSLQKSVSELTKAEEGYSARKDGDSRYYQYYNLDISDSDFERPINITYQDTYSDTDTRFLLDGKDVGNPVSMSDTIYAGIKTLWAEYLKKDITAKRGEYQFSRWKFLWNEKEYSENEIKNQTIDFYNDNTHSLTVQPVWNGSYTCDANYPENQGDGKEPEQGSAEVGTNIELPTVKDIDGKYIFKGWLDSDENAYEGGASYPIEKAKETFTGQWRAVPYDVRFVDEDGTEYSKETVPYGNRYSWNRTPSKTGYTFKGWELDKELYPEKGDIEMPDRNITFTAQWSINSYKISYNGNGAAMGVPAETVEQNYQTDYTIDTVVPTKTGYTFQGWSDGTTTYQPGAVFKVPARDVVLTAQWKANSHQVKYDGNGGKTSAPESKSADYNSNVSVAAGLEKDGYLFDGWEQISTGKVLTPGASFVMPDMDETLKAKWKIAYTGIYEAGVYYLIQGQSYILGPGRKAQGDSSTYTANVTIYVPQSGYYTFE